MNIPYITFGNKISSIEDYRKNKQNSQKQNAFPDLNSTSSDIFVKGKSVSYEKILSDFESDEYNSIEGKNRWVDKANKYLSKTRAQEIASKLDGLLYSNSLMKDMKKAKKEKNDDAVYDFFDKAILLNNRLGLLGISGEYTDNIADGLDILEYSYTNDSLTELTRKKDNSVFLSDFIGLNNDSFDEDKKNSVTEELEEYFDESFLTAPNPVLKLEMQLDSSSKADYMKAFEMFLSMAEKASQKYKDKYE